MTRWPLLLVGLAFAAPAACSDDFEEKGRPADAGSDTPLLGDSTANDVEAPPAGEICGDMSGLQVGAAWPMLGGCPKRPSYAPRGGPQGSTIRWSTPIPAADGSAVVSAEGIVWFGSTDGRAVALSAYYGNVLGSIVIAAGAIPSTPAIEAGGLAMFAAPNGHLYGIAPGAPSVVDAGLDADADADGGDASVEPPARIAVDLAADGPITSSPALAKDGAIVVATTTGKVVALRNGAAPKWSVTTGGDGVASPTIASNGRVYVSGAGHMLQALDLETGQKVWEAPVGAPLVFIAIGGDDAAYVGSADGKVHAIEPDGKDKWTYATEGAITGAPALKSGVAYVGSADKKLHAVSLADGKKKWEYATLGSVASPVVMSDGTVFFGSADGNLYAVKPSGLLFYAVNVKGAVKGAPAVGADGTIYVTTTNAIVAVGP